MTNRLREKITRNLKSVHSARGALTLLEKIVRRTVLDRVEDITSILYLNRLSGKGRAVSGKMRVVYLVQNPAVWGKIEPVFERLNRMEGLESILLAIPDHELRDTSWTRNTSYEYFKNKRCKVIRADQPGGGWISLRKLRPDYVFYQRPYNAHLPAIYRSRRVVRYAKICYIAYGFSVFNIAVDTFNREFMKHVYFFFAENTDIANLVRAMFPHSGKVRNILDIGYPSLETAIRMKERGSHSVVMERKTVIWTPRWTLDDKVGRGHFLDYKDSMLRFAESHGDHTFIVRPHPLTFPYMVESGRMRAGEVEEYREACDRLPNVSLDEEPEYLPTFFASDLLVSDISTVMMEYFLTGKPIVYCRSKVKELSDFKRISETFYTCSDWNEVEMILDRLLRGVDPKKDERERLVKQYCEKYKNSTENIVSRLLEDYEKKSAQKN